MSIEFNCAKCGRMLRVAESAAGKRAKCPKCEHINPIPEPGSTDLDEELGLPPLPPTPSASQGAPMAQGDPFAGSAANPYSSPRSGYEPFGKAVEGSAWETGKIHNVVVDINSILNYSIAVWRQHLGILVGATVVMMAVNILASYIATPFAVVLQQGGQREAAAVVNGLGSVVGWFVQVYLWVGVTQLILKLARNEPAEFTDIFNGGERFLPASGVWLLYLLIVFLGLLLLVVPGVIAGLVWLPCWYLVVDRKIPVIDSFREAMEITRGNLLTLFLVWLAGLAITMIGFLACCVGVLVAIPLVQTMYVVSYLMMSGQLPLNPDTKFDRTLVS